MTPVRKRVIILLDAKVERTSGGIYLPQDQRDLPSTGTVHSVGTYPDGTPLPIQAGDRVVFDRYQGTTFEEQGVEYKVIHFDLLQLVERVGAEYSGFVVEHEGFTINTTIPKE